MRALVVVLLHEGIEARLLLGKIGRRGECAEAKGFQFESRAAARRLPVETRQLLCLATVGLVVVDEVVSRLVESNPAGLRGNGKAMSWSF